MQQTHWCSLSLLVCAEQWRLYDNRCVWVWTESCSIFASVLRRSAPHERIPTWLPVERQGWGSERGKPLWQVACRPSSHTTQTAQNPAWLLYTCTLDRFQPAAQLVLWTGSQEHALGDKYTEWCTCKPSHRKQPRKMGGCQLHSWAKTPVCLFGVLCVAIQLSVVW